MKHLPNALIPWETESEDQIEEVTGAYDQHTALFIGRPLLPEILMDLMIQDMDSKDLIEGKDKTHWGQGT